MFASKTRYLGMSALALAIGGAVVATPAMAEGELSASAAVASMYLWRGIDLGDGSPAVSGDLVYSVGGAYGGIWISSGDDDLGSEYDLFVGYGSEIGDFSFDISLWNYNYSNAGLFNKTGGFGVSDDTTGELSEIITTVGYKGVSLSYYDNIAGGSGYEYWTLSGGYEKFSATLGYHDFNVSSASMGNDDMTHLDISYAFNDNLSFTASKVVDQDCDKNGTNCTGSIDEDVKFVVAYSLPIEM